MTRPSALTGFNEKSGMLGKFCDACQAIPAAGYCGLAGCPMMPPSLIAAAPELLEALKALLPEGWGDDDTMDHIPGVKQARLAIAKAEGRS